MLTLRHDKEKKKEKKQTDIEMTERTHIQIQRRDQLGLNFSDCLPSEEVGPQRKLEMAPQNDCLEIF